jgi:decaprenylphospho-beta-D-ribofuranose 2-oxidase
MALPQAPRLEQQLVLERERIARVSGYGLASAADGYVYRPTTVAEIREVLDLAGATGRKVVQRGAGRSYGDASIGAERVVLDLTRMRRILSWNKESGIIEAEAGVTIQDLWRHCLEDGYWPPVVSGTMFPTLGGALGMNIHGKNNLRAGTFGEHVLEIEVLSPRGELVRYTPDDDGFYAVISSAGLLGVITRVRLRMKRIHSGDLRVLPLSCASWEEQFALFERFEPDADYMVSWVDCFGRGAGAGRGQFHAAWYADEPGEHPTTLRIDHQEVPDTVLGFCPKSVMWRPLRLLNNQLGMRFINAAKHHASRFLGNGRPHYQSLVAFSFLLDYVPNWRWAYLPSGFIQYQSFVPKESAARVFARQVELQQEAGLVSFLGVLKRHRPDRFLFSHAVDGYSLALDFKVTPDCWPHLQRLAHHMNDLVLEAGGRFYLAKDSTLRPEDARAYLGEETLRRYREWKAQLDPEGLLTSALAERVGLVD